MPNKWEFPGGKLEKDETLKECGIREIKEEQSLTLNQHTQSAWIDFRELASYDFPAINLSFIKKLKITEN